MYKKFHIIFLIFIGFFLNAILFIFSDNYRYFLQSLRYDDTEYEISDKFKISIRESYKPQNEKSDDNDLFSGLSGEVSYNNKLDKKTDNRGKEGLNKNNTPLDNSKSQYLNKREEIKLTNIENEILEKFKQYNLKKIDLHPRLFDLTGEYPDEYFEYYGKDINLYFFGNKLYSDIKDIFEVLTYELPFSINEVNNFGGASFYLNLNGGFDDNSVRLIIKKSNRIIGLKVSRDLYNEIKDDLGILFPKK